MIARNITKSKKIAAASERARCVYMMLMPFTDREGRMIATPSYLKGAVFRHLEYTEAELEAVIWELHDLTLVSVYSDEDDLVLQVHDFLEFNRPANKESASELPAPTAELMERDLKAPTSGPRTPAPSNARAMPEQGTGKVRAEVEVEVEVESETEVEVEVEGKKKPRLEQSGTSRACSRQIEVAPATPEAAQTVNLIRSKLGAKYGGDGEDLFLECMSEDPSREAWLHLPPNSVRSLIRKATSRFRKGEKFKSTLITLLDQETRLERTAIKEKEPLRRPSDDVEEEYRRRKAAGESFTPD